MSDQIGIAIAFTLFGWLLGILQPAISEAIRRRRETREVISALQIELDELRYRSALATYMLQMRFGKIDKVFLKWVRSKIEKYEGTNPRDDLLSSVVGQLERLRRAARSACVDAERKVRWRAKRQEICGTAS